MGAREKILETAARLFLTDGYQATSLAQVARAAQVSKALILWHFDRKEQLFRAALQHFLIPYEIDDRTLSGLTESEQIEKLIDDYYAFIAEHLSSVKFVLGQVVREDDNSHELVLHARQLYQVYCGLLTTILERGKARGFFTSDLRPAEDATLIMATLNGLLVQRLVSQEETETAQDLLQYLKRTLLARLNAPLAQTEVAFPSVENFLPPTVPSQRTER
jgi:AcrR family transcriptional regulator